MWVVADVPTALYNPQLSRRSRSPFAVDLECDLISWVATRFGFDDDVGRSVYNGCSEANTTTVLCVLGTRFSDWAETGVRVLRACIASAWTTEEDVDEWVAALQ